MLNLCILFLKYEIILGFFCLKRIIIFVIMIENIFIIIYRYIRRLGVNKLFGRFVFNFDILYFWLFVVKKIIFNFKFFK